MTRRALLTATLLGLVACSGPPEHATRKSGECARCHLAEFRSTRHPKHEGEKPVTCGTCHTEDSWHPARLRHEWPLDGAHEHLACAKCHETDPSEAEAPKTCVGCHRALYDKPPFTAHDKFSTVCDECHTTRDWKHTKPHDRAAQSAPERPAAAPTVAPPKPSATATAPKVSAPKLKPVPTAPPKPTATGTTKPPKPDVTSKPSVWR